ncbi:MAG: L,D-transpeptidase [Nannocystaceae bacterium]|nr:L,D-transpeptidase [Nannocystaceae bacterium]
MTVAALPALLALNTFSALQGVETWGEHPTAIDPVEVGDSEVRFVAAKWGETVVRGRPWVPYKRVATISKGTRLRVRGVIASRDKQGCHGKDWFAVFPFGYVCSEQVRETDKAPVPGPALPVAAGLRLPHSYAVVRQPDTPMYDSVEDAEAGIVARRLTKGMTLVGTTALDIAGESYLRTRDGKIVPKYGVSWMGQGSDWQGVYLDVEETGPVVAWTRNKKTPVRSEPSRGAAVVRTLGLRKRVPLIAPNTVGLRPLWWQIGEGEWIEADKLNELHIIEPPPGVLTDFRTTKTGNDQWIDVDVGEQVLVAYRGVTPVYATLISSGRGSPTPLGNYPIWAKVASMDMSSQDYEDKAYMVQGVPWVLLFQGHNALHGAYWHNRFGNRKSHGCVNLAPYDARWVFEWAGPMLPRGWTGYLPSDLDRSVVVHVRDSSKGVGATFTQQRKRGPPDREAERRKSDAAQKRRAMADARDAALDALDRPTEPDQTEPAQRPPKLNPVRPPPPPKIR